ncbi:hypothetical protein [Alcaligenes sp. Lyrl_28]|uniref:hypothetical protein n=1 Tax=Alcaligenes sp. Lyrl_28 TaxID=3110924 RepID=UPI003F7C79D7
MTKLELTISNTQPIAVDPTSESMNYMVMVAFPKSTSKNYSAALSLAQHASQFKVANIGDTLMNIALFDKTTKDAQTAVALIQRVGEWKGVMIFSNGVRAKRWYEVTETLNCFIQSAQCRNPLAHCVSIIDDPEAPPSMRNIVSIVEGSRPIKTKTVGIRRFAFPCRLLLRDMKIERGHPASIPDQIHAAGVAHNKLLCPRFNPDAYAQVETEWRETDDI